LAHKLRVHFAIASCGRLTAPDLQALPKTPLWEKLEREGRLDTKQDLESNARFRHPRREVVASWRRVIAYAYAPERVFARFRYHVDATYVNRLRLRQRASWRPAKRVLLYGEAILDRSLIRNSRLAGG
jgi:hopanoid C-2 methylase